MGVQPCRPEEIVGSLREVEVNLALGPDAGALGGGSHPVVQRAVSPRSGSRGCGERC